DPGFPDLLAGIRIEGDDAASGCTAGVIGIAAAKLLGRRHRDEQLAVIEPGTGSDARDKVWIDLCLPQQSSGLRIEREHVGSTVAEVHGESRAAPAGDRSDC